MLIVAEIVGGCCIAILSGIAIGVTVAGLEENKK